MATSRIKRKLAEVSRGIPEGTKKSRAQNTLDPELAEDYVSQVSEEIEGRITKKPSKESSRTESPILGALSKRDEILLNAQVRTCSIAVPGTSGNNDSEKREHNGDRSLNDPCPEVVCSSHHSGHLNSSEVDECPHTLTGGPEENRHRSHMMTGIQEEFHYCSPGIPPGKQRKARSTSQPQFRSENNPATIEADQFLLALKQLATSTN